LNNPLRYIDPDGHQTTTADALKAGATLVVAAPHPVAKVIGAVIIVGVVVEKTVGWENVGNAVKWFGSGNTVGDSSCPGCMSSQRMGQSLMSNSNSSSQNGNGGQANSSRQGNDNANNSNAANGGSKPSGGNKGGSKAPKKGSGKERASDIPSWAKGQQPQKGENGTKFAKRLLDEKYGPGKYKTGPGSEYNKLKKFGDRGFQN